MNRIWFKNIRKSLGLTQHEVAELITEERGIQISRAMIGHIETGNATPSVDIAKIISLVLDFEKFGHSWTDFYEN